MAAREIRPITDLKNATAALVHEVAEGGGAVTITQNDEARAVIIGVREYDRMRQTLGLLKLLSLASADARDGRLVPQSKAMARLDAVVDPSLTVDGS